MAASNKIRNVRSAPSHNYDQKVLGINRVVRVIKGGRRLRFRALVVLGDGKGNLGVGCAKGSDITIAIDKAAVVAQKTMKRVVLTKVASIPHEVSSKVGGAQILLKPAKEGTGLIAGSVTRQILEIAGYHNIYSKSLGNSNKLNLAYAVIKALDQLVPEENWHLKQLENKTATLQKSTPAVEKTPAVAGDSRAETDSKNREVKSTEADDDGQISDEANKKDS